MAHFFGYEFFMDTDMKTSAKTSKRIIIHDRVIHNL